MKKFKNIIYYAGMLFRLMKWKWIDRRCWGLCVNCKYKKVCLPELEEILKPPF